jgi:hypothetical protein
METVGIHVRKTDFYKDMTSTDYFVAAIDLLEQRLGHQRLCFVVITDHPEWVRESLLPILKGRSPCVHFSESSIGVDMCQMTLCKHMIMSSGTFGYFAALLKEKEGLVLYDRYFFSHRLFLCPT